MMSGGAGVSNGGGGSSSSGAHLVSGSMGSPFDNILGSDWNGISNQDPLSNLMDSVNSLDPLNSMGKSLNEQMSSLVNSASTSTGFITGVQNQQQVNILVNDHFFFSSRE